MRDAPSLSHHGDLKRAFSTANMEIIRARGVEALIKCEARQRLGGYCYASHRHFRKKRQMLCAVAADGCQTLCERLEALAAATVARCQEQGQFRPGGNLALISLLMDGQLLTDGDEDAFPLLLTNNLAKQPKDADKLMDLIVDVLLWGLAPRAERPGA